MMRWLWLLLFLVASVASAERITTFAWDNGTNWPVGTTVELCANDLCVPGLTGTHHTMTVPVQLGSVISAKARAVTPSGYQCGDPPGPCPYSEWATLAQTWPNPPINGWARKEIATNMAISYLGYVTVDSTVDISQSITVPENTDYALIFRGGWASTAQTVTEISLDGVAATLILNVAVSNDFQDVYLYGVPVSSGSKTLVHNLSGTFSEGGTVIVAFFSGVNTANPVLGNNYSQYAGGPTNQTPTWSLASEANGIGAVFITGYNDNLSITTTSQAQTNAFNNLLYNSNLYGLGYKLTTGTPTTFGCSATGNYLYMTAVAVTLKPSSGVSGASLPPDILTSKYTHIIVR